MHDEGIAAAAETRGKGMNPTQAIDGYFAAIRAKDVDALMALYADDPVFILPDGRTFEGKDAIRAMHEHVIGAGSPFPTPGTRIVALPHVTVEIEAALPDGSVRRTANHYTLSDDGLIERLSVYVKLG